MLVTDPETPEDKAGLALLNAAYQLGAEHRLCPVCLLIALTKAVEQCLEEGSIKHGVPAPDIKLTGLA